jgi:hypothetical protein
MKQIYFQLLFLVIIILAKPAFSQDDKADAIFLKLEKEYTLNEDGSTDFRLKKELKLLTHYSFHRLYGETFIVYNTDYQELKINKSFTVMADGKVVQTPENAFNQLLPRYASDAPDHNFLREMAITHTGLERDAVINLDYSLHTKKGFFPVFYVQDFLLESSPIDELIIKIKIPKTKDPAYQLLNIDVEPKISEEGNYKTYTWKFNNLPAHIYEQKSPNLETYSPLLLFSTASSRDEYVKAIISRPAFEYQVNDKMRKKVESLRTDASDDLDLALKIQDYVIKEFKLKSISSKLYGYTYREAYEIWESAYATSAEKMILMTALLKLANLDATPYAVIESNLDLDEIKAPLIREYTVRVDTKDGDYFFLSATDQNKQDMAYEFVNKQLLKLSFLENLKLYKAKKGDNKLKVEGKINLTKEGYLKGEIDAEITDALNPYFDLKNNDSKAKSFLSGGFSSSDCETVVVKTEAEKTVVTYELKSKKELEKRKKYMFFEIPELNTGINGMHIHELPTERLYPFQLSHALNESYKYEINISDEMKAVNKNVKIEEKNNIGELIIEIKNSGKKLIVKRSIKFHKDLISPEEYPAFRKMMNLWNNKNHKTILITSL